jgi:beta-glucosidase/6-phospho-beta-glucosidase/beta-galactosidase
VSTTGLSPSTLSPEQPFQSFWMGGYEGADFINGRGEALDNVRSSGHLDGLDDDYEAAAALGIRTVRESIGWRLAEPAPRRYDLERAARIARAARRHGIQVLWSLMHYGTPADIDLFDDALIDRFAAYAAAVADRLAPLHDAAPVYTPINEIGFLSWVVSSSADMWPYKPPEGGGGSETSGYAVKCRLVRAALAAMAAMRSVDPRCRFLHVEPVVHVVAPRDRPDLDALAAEVCEYQWQAWDLLAGRLDPHVGGCAQALDLLGANHYASGQWEVHTERRLSWQPRDPRRRPLADLLDAVWQRYRRPLILSETSHEGEARVPWLHEMASEVQRARARGVPVQGVCLYPLIDRVDWHRTSQWHHSGLWDVSDPPRETPPRERRLCADYAAALAHWQRVLPTTSHRQHELPSPAGEGPR